MAHLVLTRSQTTREADSVAVALLGEAIDVGTTGVRQAEQAPYLIECLTGGIIKRAAKFLNICGDIAYTQDGGVPTGHHETNEVLRERTINKLIDTQVTDDVVDTVQWLARGQSESLGGRYTHGQ